MNRRARLIISALLFSGAAWAHAEPVAPETGVTRASDRTDPEPEPARAKRNRPISSSLASTLASSMPKYNPPPKPKPEEETDQEVDLRDVDKPRNQIIRLPKYVVQEAKPPVFRERDLHSLNNRTSLAMQRYAGLNLGPFSRLNRPIALAMYQEQERLDNMADLEDTARTISVGDPAAGTYIRRESSETFMRSSDFGFQSGPK